MEIEYDCESPGPEGVEEFSASIVTILNPFGFSKVEQYWRREIRGYWPDVTHYRLIFANTWVKLEFSILGEASINLKFTKVPSKGDYYDDFELGHVIEVASLPSFFRTRDRGLQGAKFLFAFAHYMQDIVSLDFIQEIFLGRYWFPFRFFWPEWDTDPQGQKRTRKKFLATRNT